MYVYSLGKAVEKKAPFLMYFDKYRQYVSTLPFCSRKFICTLSVEEASLNGFATAWGCLYLSVQTCKVYISLRLISRLSFWCI